MNSQLDVLFKPQVQNLYNNPQSATNMNTLNAPLNSMDCLTSSNGRAESMSCFSSNSSDLESSNNSNGRIDYDKINPLSRDYSKSNPHNIITSTNKDLSFDTLVCQNSQVSDPSFSVNGPFNVSAGLSELDSRFGFSNNDMVSHSKFPNRSDCIKSNEADHNRMSNKQQYSDILHNVLENPCFTHTGDSYPDTSILDPRHQRFNSELSLQAFNSKPISKPSNLMGSSDATQANPDTSSTLSTNAPWSCNRVNSLPLCFDSSNACDNSDNVDLDAGIAGSQTGLNSTKRPITGGHQNPKLGTNTTCSTNWMANDPNFSSNGPAQWPSTTTNGHGKQISFSTNNVSTTNNGSWGQAIGQQPPKQANLHPLGSNVGNSDLTNLFGSLNINQGSNFNENNGSVHRSMVNSNSSSSNMTGQTSAFPPIKTQSSGTYPNRFNYPPNMYNMFPKRAVNRTMQNWQQQQNNRTVGSNLSGNELISSNASSFDTINAFQQFNIASDENSLNQQSNQLAHAVSNSLASIGSVNYSNDSKASVSTSGDSSCGINTSGDNYLSMDNFNSSTPSQHHTVSQQHLQHQSQQQFPDSSANTDFKWDDCLRYLYQPPDSNDRYPMVMSNNLMSNNLNCNNNHQQQMMPNFKMSLMSNDSTNSSNGSGLNRRLGYGSGGLPNLYSSFITVPPRDGGFSRKVFVGGLPPDIDEEGITTSFRRFGPLIVDWPHKTESKAYFPPKGYCFLLFQDERYVKSLINACIVDDEKYYWCVSSPTMKDKPVQIRPWNLADSDYVLDDSQMLDPRKTIFVGGVPRPLRAIELALIMDRFYGNVCYAGIDTDPELRYPKGAGRVTFSTQQSYISAISARFVQLQHNEIDKRVEVKPYVLDNQMCDECQGSRCGGKFAPFFCANVACLQYYCELCWVQIHSRQGRESHKPLVKEGSERPRGLAHRW